jgi:hypothetical protein
VEKSIRCPPGFVTPVRVCSKNWPEINHNALFSNNL